MPKKRKGITSSAVSPSALTIDDIHVGEIVYVHCAFPPRREKYKILSEPYERNDELGGWWVRVLDLSNPEWVHESEASLHDMGVTPRWHPTHFTNRCSRPYYRAEVTTTA